MFLPKVNSTLTHQLILKKNVWVRTTGLSLAGEQHFVFPMFPAPVRIVQAETALPYFPCACRCVCGHRPVRWAGTQAAAWQHTPCQRK